MSALALVQLKDGTGQWTLELNRDDEFRNAITISLLTEARARPDDPITDSDKRGWWGNSYADVPGFELGSRLWILAGRPLTPELQGEAETYAREALQWFIDDGVVKAWEIAAERVSDTVIGLAIYAQQPDDLAPVLVGIWEIALNA